MNSQIDKRFGMNPLKDTKAENSRLSGGAKFLLTAAAVIGGLCFCNPLATPGQNTAKAAVISAPSALDQQALDYGRTGFSNLWVKSGDDYYIHYSIPPNSFTPVLGQDQTIIRFVEAKGVRSTLMPAALTTADKLNGIEWRGQLSFAADAAREFDCASGWGAWVERPALIVFNIEKVNGKWQGKYTFALAVPPNADFQQLHPDEVPLATDVAHSPRLCSVRGAAPAAPSPPKASSQCGVHYLSDGTITGRPCYGR